MKNLGELMRGRSGTYLIGNAANPRVRHLILSRKGRGRFNLKAEVEYEKAVQGIDVQTFVIQLLFLGLIKQTSISQTMNSE